MTSPRTHTAMIATVVLWTGVFPSDVGAQGPALSVDVAGRRDMEQRTAAETTVVCSLPHPSASPVDTIDVRTFTDPPDTTLTYAWSTAVGRIEGIGATARWILVGAPLGVHRASVRLSRQGDYVGGCSASVLVRLPEAARGTGDLLARALLLPAEREDEGYGLYGYLLFGSRPTKVAIDRYRSALAEYVRLMPDISEFSSAIAGEDGARRRETTLSYIPVRRHLQGTDPDTVAALLANYDFARAQILLRALPGMRRAGPYLVFVRRPLTGRARVEREYLIEDLSVVPDRLVPLWVAQSLTQASQENMERAWDQKRMVLMLRTALVVLAEGIPEVKKAMADWKETFQQWVSWKK